MTGKAPALNGHAPFASHEDAAFTGTGDALLRSLAMAVIPVLVMAIVVPLLAWAASEAGTGLRVALRLLLTIPVAGFAPAIVGVAWAHATSQTMPLSVLAPLSDSALARMSVINGLAGVGLICGVGVAALLAALRRRRTDRPGRTVANAVVIWGVAVLGTLAVSLQSSTLVTLLTSGGPAMKTTTLPSLEYRSALQMFRPGAGAAAGTVLLAVVAVLGLAAGLLLVLSKSRFEVDRERRTVGLLSGSSRGIGVVLGVLALVAVLVVVVLALLPHVGLLTGYPGAARDTVHLDMITDRLVDSLLAAVLTVLVQVPLAYLAGLGVGAFRPLGRRSEWLLLPFSPWLFVSVAPLMTIAFINTVNHDHMNSMIGTMSPILVSVPAMFLFALFAKGHQVRWQAARESGVRAPFARTVLLPSLPLLALVTVLALVVQAHDLFWPLVVNTQPSAPVMLVQMVLRAFSAGPPPMWLLAAAAPFALVALLALLLLQVFYLDRLAFRTGPADAGAVPDAAAGP
ncbi:MAG: hypothetical protein WCA46_06830, partial [Actinocatenispora sp.]